MTSSEPSQQTNPAETSPAPMPPTDASEVVQNDAAQSSGESRPRILIGSQRDPAAYRPKRRDWVPVADSQGSGETGTAASGEGAAAKGRRRRPRRAKGPSPARQASGVEAAAEKVASDTPFSEPNQSATDLSEPIAPPRQLPLAASEPSSAAAPEQMPTTAVEEPSLAPSVSTIASSSDIAATAAASIPLDDKIPPPPAPPAVDVRRAKVGAVSKLPPPNIRERLSPDLEEELHRALGDVAVEDMMRGGDAAAGGEPLEPESKHHARVAMIRRDEVFVELGGREQGCLSLQQFDQPPQPGDVLEVIVRRLNADDGLYEVSLPDKALDVEDWSDLHEGMLVEGRITGHNTGGLECQVNNLRGFIPMSQIALYRVEDAAQFVGQQFTCLVTEANPERRNLVLSRRAVLEREKEEARKAFFNSLQPGQIHEGVVRKLLDFGAFVDIGGVDGLLHVSQLAWNRVGHPSEVLSEGQKIRVKIEKINPETGKIGLAYRDLLENPWTSAPSKYPVNSVIRGTVTKLMEFGAFVQLEPGVEGLVHISELSHRRVARTGDVVHEGDQIEALVLSVDAQAQRISLSMKALATPPEPAKTEGAPAEAPPPSKKPRRPDRPLQGGLGRTSGGSRFGLKW